MRGVALFSAVVFTIGFLAVGIFNLVAWVEFKTNCGDYLKLAGDAPSVERANQFLGKAVAYLENRNLTAGNSAYIFHTPKNDIGIWYKNIKGAYEVTASVLAREKANPGSVSQLEQSNALIKIREVVLDQGEKGTAVTQPDHIVVFPNQWLLLIGYLVTLALAALGWLGFYASSDYY